MPEITQKGDDIDRILVKIHTQLSGEYRLVIEYDVAMRSVFVKGQNQMTGDIDILAILT